MNLLLAFYVVAALLCIGYLSLSEGLDEFVKVGCFKDKSSPRALPEQIANYRGGLDWNNLDQVVKDCALEAQKKNYMYFSIQFYGECWSGETAPLTYDRYGPSSNCFFNVGKQWTNLVYRFIGNERECLDYATLHSADRSSLFQLPLGNSAVCDKNIAPGWYRFLPPAGVQMASSCVPSKKCATSVTGWLKSHPKMTDGIVSGTVCYSWDVCCQWSQNIRVRNCGSFYVYDLKPTISCPMRFCGQ